VVKFNCLSTDDDRLYRRAGIPVAAGLAGSVCPARQRAQDALSRVGVVSALMGNLALSLRLDEAQRLNPAFARLIGPGPKPDLSLADWLASLEANRLNYRAEIKRRP